MIRPFGLFHMYDVFYLFYCLWPDMILFYYLKMDFEIWNWFTVCTFFLHLCGNNVFLVDAAMLCFSVYLTNLFMRSCTTIVLIFLTHYELSTISCCNLISILLTWAIMFIVAFFCEVLAFVNCNSSGCEFSFSQATYIFSCFP